MGKTSGKASPPQNRSLSPAVAVAVAGLCVAFGANAVAIKICLTGMGPFTLAATRFAAAALLITGWALATGQRYRLEPGQLRRRDRDARGLRVEESLEPGAPTGRRQSSYRR